MDVAYETRGPCVPEKDAIYAVASHHGRKQSAAGKMLPYEISADDLRSLEASGRTGTGKRMMGVFGRVFGSAR
jgi:hypothetical protein